MGSNVELKEGDSSKPAHASRVQEGGRVAKRFSRKVDPFRRRTTKRPLPHCPLQIRALVWHPPCKM